MTVRSDISVVAVSRMPLGARIAEYWSAWGSAALGYAVLGIIYFLHRSTL